MTWICRETIVSPDKKLPPNNRQMRKNCLIQTNKQVLKANWALQEQETNNISDLQQTAIQTDDLLLV